MKFNKLLFLFVSALLFSSCIKNIPDNINHEIINKSTLSVEVDGVELSKSEIAFTKKKDASLVIVKSANSWTANVDVDWLSLTAESGNSDMGFLIGAAENKLMQREGTLTITAGNASKSIAIIQEGSYEINIEINGVGFKFLPVQADRYFYLDGATYLASRRVFLDSYFISETEITNEQWKAITGSLPYSDENNKSNFPVVVNWNNIVDQFIPKFNALSGLESRLPTENEWEVAARGGILSKNYGYAGSMYIDEVAWYWQNAQGMKHEVATKNPNELGLYDMSGNVSEWCSDWYLAGNSEQHKSNRTCFGYRESS